MIPRLLELRACALRAGQILSYAELARDVGISPNTAKSWISVLETSQQIFLLEPYQRARTKRLVKSPKLYFCDIGMLTYLMGFTDASELPRHALWGAVWENAVVAEIRKSFLVRGLRPLTAEYGDSSVAKAFVVCRTDRAYPLAEGGSVEAVPLAGRGGLLMRKELVGSDDAR